MQNRDINTYFLSPLKHLYVTADCERQHTLHIRALWVVVGNDAVTSCYCSPSAPGELRPRALVGSSGAYDSFRKALRLSSVLRTVYHDKTLDFDISSSPCLDVVAAALHHSVLFKEVVGTCRTICSRSMEPRNSRESVCA